MKIQNVKSGYDFLSKEQRIRNYINNTLKEVFEEYGFNSIETPILCYCDMLADKYDKNNDILKEIEMNKRMIKKSMDYTNKEKIPYLIALGEDEVNKKSFNIKNMFSGEQIQIQIDNLTKINEIV